MTRLTVKVPLPVTGPPLIVKSPGMARATEVTVPAPILARAVAGLARSARLLAACRNDAALLPLSWMAVPVPLEKLEKLPLVDDAGPLTFPLPGPDGP